MVCKDSIFYSFYKKSILSLCHTMDNNREIFDIQISSADNLWWHFNLFASLVCYDKAGEVLSFVNAIDNDSRQSERKARPPMNFSSNPCDHIELYFYAVPASLPSSRVVRDTTPFGAQIVISASGKVIKTIPCEVNQYGGVTIVAERVG